MHTVEELEAMTKKELVAYANLQFGLGVNANYNKAELVKLIERTQRSYKGNEGVRVVKEGSNDRCRPGEVKVRLRPGKYDKVPRPVIVGHNFKLAAIPVNQDVIMPAKYLQCLQDAQQDVYFQDPETNELMQQKEYTYDFTVLERGS